MSTPNQIKGQTLAEIAQDNRKEIEEGIAHYTPFIEQNMHAASHRMGMIKAFYNLIDQDNARFHKQTNCDISCKKGCAFCCYIRVESTPWEAEYIAAYIVENKIKVDKKWLEQQAEIYDNDLYMTNPFSRCAMLGADNTCQIYDVRPFACRNLFVISPAEECDTKTHPKGHVISPFNIHAITPVLALVNQIGEDNFAKLLLQELNKLGYE